MTLKTFIGEDERGHYVKPKVEMVRDKFTVDKPKLTKSLSAGAGLLVRLAVGFVTYGALAPASIASVAANAGLGTLCAETTTAFLENDGRIDKALKAAVSDRVLKATLRSALTAGVARGLTDMVAEASGAIAQASGAAAAASSGATQATGVAVTGYGGVAKSITDYAREALIQSTADTVVGAFMDKTPFEKLLSRNLMGAAVNTAAAWGAGRIGSLKSAGEVNLLGHKALHGALGAAFGASVSAINHSDPRLGALSGAFGAVTAEMIAEGFEPEKIDIEAYALTHPGESRAGLFERFEASARRTASWGALIGAAAAMGVGLDAGVAHASAQNAVTHNYLPSATLALIAACGYATHEYALFVEDLKRDGAVAALSKLGIRLVDAATLALAIETGVGVLPYAYSVGGAIVKSLREALAIASKNPGLSGEARQLHGALGANLPKVEAIVAEGVYARGVELAESQMARGGAVERVAPGKVKIDGKLFQEHHILSNKSRYTRHC